ncbi:hypothetical protein BDF22DRAFT_742460 [Syncephalis plumigaleata]|nr:hypothetical protein BDF22DRAFT_742460 [Syncephalis plumigaleata]
MTIVNYNLALHVYECTYDEVANKETCIYDANLLIIFSFSCVLHGIGVALGVFTLCYRIRHRLYNGLWHRVDGYPMPRPLDGLIICLLPHPSIQLLLYITSVFDWWHLQVVRDILVSVDMMSITVSLVVFIASSIVHIPSVFVWRTTLKGLVKCSRLQHSLLLRVPKPRILYHIMIWFNLFIMIVLLSLALWLGIAVDHYDSVNMTNAIITISLFVTTMATIIVVITSYYSHGFYKILSNHAQPSGHKSPLTKEELHATYYFRSLFLLILIYSILTAFITLPSYLLLRQIATIPWLHYIVIIVHHIVIFPICQKTLTIGSALRAASTSSNRSNNRTTQTQSNLHGDDTISNGSLLWHSLYISESTTSKPIQSRDAMSNDKSFIDDASRSNYDANNHTINYPPTIYTVTRWHADDSLVLTAPASPVSNQMNNSY